MMDLLKLFKDSHEKSDVDVTVRSMHHTLGKGPTQASPGNHLHAGTYSPVGHTHAFEDSGWIALAPLLVAPWVDFGGGVTPSAYRLFNGFVMLRGVIKSGAINTVAATLPVGYRTATPGGDYRRFAVDGNPGAHAAVAIYPNGDIKPYAGSNVYIALDNIIYVKEG